MQNAARDLQIDTGQFQTLNRTVFSSQFQLARISINFDNVERVLRRHCTKYNVHWIKFYQNNESSE